MAADGLVAGVLFVLPGFVSILALSVLYAGYRNVTFVEGFFYGLKPAVVAVVLAALLRIGQRSLKNHLMTVIAALAFLGIFFLQVPFPVIILSAGLIGLVGGRLRPDLFVVIKGHGAKQAEDHRQYAITDEDAAAVRPSLGRTIRVATVWLAIWLLPVAALLGFAGRESVYSQEALFFSRAAMVTFGGAYSVLAYVAQRGVDTYGWLEPGEMLDGLGMAETTPGPLIQVVQFVGFLGAYRDPGPLSPLEAGIAGSLITTWVTFAPCFLWIFLGAPYIEYLRGRESLHAALSTITAAVVGVILNLSLWFAIHTLFAVVDEEYRYGLRLLVPDWRTLDPVALSISIAALVAMLRLRIGMLPTLAASATGGLLYYLLSG